MIAFVFALEFESAAFRATQSPQLCVEIWNLGVTGAHSAEVLRRRIAINRPEIIVSAGFSGALDPDLELGAIVIGKNYTDPDLFRVLRAFPQYRTGSIVTAPHILETSAAKKELAASSGALAGDLESGHLHSVCLEVGIKMLSVRTISDTLQQDLPVPADILINPETGKTDPAAIFRYLFTHPAKAAQFARLVTGAKVAQQSLAKALGEILPALLRQGNGAAG